MKKTNNFKKFLALGIVLVFMFTMAMATTVSAAKSVNDIKQSVVYVAGAAGSGSGFAIGKTGKPIQYIVTNNHVVRGDLGYTTATVVFDGASNETMVANIYLYDEKRDIAVLKLPKPTDARKPLVICPSDKVNLDDEFRAFGYPAGEVTDYLQINTSDITVTTGWIKKADRVDSVDVYMLDLHITHGNSGGPLVNSNGEVVGINTFGLTTMDASGTLYENNYAVSIDELLSMDGFDKIPVTKAGESDSNLILFIAIGGGALLLIIILVIILVASRKKKNKVELPAPTPAPEAPVYEQPVDPIPVGGTSYVDPAPVPGAPSARLVAVSGLLQGKRYSVSGSVKIGRDASKCALSFPVNTQGVSGVHCEVSFDGSVCYVKDLGSSYGTFTMDGRKLQPNAPQFLKSGDKFYLASRENTFEVRF